MKCPMNVVVFFTLFFLFLKWVRKNNTCLPLVMAAQHCVFYAQQLSLQQSFIKHPWSKYLTWLLKSFSKSISFHEELQNLTPFFKKNARCLNKYILLTYVTRIQRAWRASMSRRESWQAQDKNRTNDHWRETVPSESLQEPVMTTNISPVRLRKQNQTAIWCDMRMSQVLRDVLCEWSAVICCYSREWITNGGRGCTDG